MADRWETVRSRVAAWRRLPPTNACGSPATRVAAVIAAAWRRLPLREDPLPSRPLVVVAVCLVAGCAWGSWDSATAGHPPGISAHWRAGVHWLAAVACVITWHRAASRRHGILAVASLCLAVCSGAAAWSVARSSLFAADELAWHLSTRPTPVAIRGIVLESPSGLPPASPDPRLAAAIGPSSEVSLAVSAVRDGARWRAASGVATVVVGAAPADLPPLVVGTAVELTGRALRRQPALNPGEFDAARRARLDRSLSIVRVRSAGDMHPLAPPPAWSVAAAVDRLRAGGAAALRACVSAERMPLADALLLGNRSLLARDEADRFLVTGTIHILSISGLHVGLIALALFGIVRWLPVPRPVALLVVASCTGLYMVLVRAETPVVRATVLVWLACGAAAAGRHPASLTGLAVAAVVVLVRRPSDVLEVGPQLSFLATAVLVGVAALDRERRGRPVDPIDRLIDRSRPPWHRWLLRRWSGAAALCLAGAAVWIVTTPLVAARFHVVSPVGLVLNVAIAPLVSIAMLAGFACLAVAAFSTSLAAGPGFVCDAALAIVDRLVAWGALVPGGHVWVAGPPWWWVVGWYALVVLIPCLLAAVQVRRATVWIVTAAAWCATGVVATTAARLVAPAPAELRVVVASMGHGCGILVRAPGARTLLYDAGRLGAPAAARRALTGLLWSEGITRIDTAVVSHADADHFNALPDLLDRFTVGEVVVPEPFLQSRSVQAAELLRRVAARGVPVRVARAGDSFALSTLCRVRVLHPPAAAHPLPAGPDHRAADNETSLVLSVESAGRRLLLTGDIERDALRRFVAAGVESCDVLVAPHHGSRTSLPPDIARVTRPSWVLVSGSGNGAWPEVRSAYLRAAASMPPDTSTPPRTTTSPAACLAPPVADASVAVVKTGDEGAVALSITAGGITASRWMGAWRAGVSYDDHGVFQPSDPVDVDQHAISGGERERLVRDDARAREQHDTVRKRL